MKTSEWFAWFDIPLFLLVAGAVVLRAWVWDARHIIGMGIGAAGFVLWVTARWQLGKSFSVRPEARALVTTGLYSRFSNPIYLFGGVAYGGVFLAWGNVIAFIIFLPGYIAFQYPRVKREREVLEKAFGDEYRRYKTRTWM
jgi:protein-S-isoprenylcysteine O-methyltransferase Ste14